MKIKNQQLNNLFFPTILLAIIFILSGCVKQNEKIEVNGIKNITPPIIVKQQEVDQETNQPLVTPIDIVNNNTNVNNNASKQDKNLESSLVKNNTLSDCKSKLDTKCWYIYKNKEFDFEVKIPSSWGNYKIEITKTDGILGSVSFSKPLMSDYADRDYYALLIIDIVSESWWKKELSYDQPHPSLFQIKNGNVYIYSIAQDGTQQDYDETLSVVKSFKLISNDIMPVEVNQNTSMWSAYESKSFGIKIKFPKELDISIKELEEKKEIYGPNIVVVPAHLEMVQPSRLQPEVVDVRFVDISLITKKSSESLTSWFNKNIDPTESLLEKKIITENKLLAGNALYNNTGHSFGDVMTSEYRDYLQKNGPQYWFGFIELSPTKILEVTYAGQDNVLSEYLGNDSDFNKKLDILLIKIMESMEKIN